MAFRNTSQSSPEDADFWLPPEFLSDEHYKHKHTFFNMFPTEVEDSLLCSAESDSSSSDEDDFYATLTRRFAQTTTATAKLKPEWKAMAGSPQSTLSGMGSWSTEGSPNGPSQVTSPPATPFPADNDTWELIYAAAGQVARLKMASSQNIQRFSQIPNTQGRGLLGNPNVNDVRNHHPNNIIQFGAVKPPVAAQQWVRQKQVGHSYHQQNRIQRQSQSRNIMRNSRGDVCGYDDFGRCGGRTLNLGRSTLPPMARPALANGSEVKRICAGTGVFLPRKYSNPPETRKKTTGCPNVVLPAKVVHALNMSFEDMDIGHSQPHFGCGFAPDYEALMARRNALLEQQRRSLRPEGALNHEIRLPQEWTY